MKLYEYKIKYQSKYSYTPKAKGVNIIANNQKEARKAALNRFYKILKAEYGYTLKDLEYRDISLLDSHNVAKDGFIDVMVFR